MFVDRRDLIVPTNSLVRSTGFGSTVMISTAVGGRAGPAGPAGPAPVAPPLPHPPADPRKRTMIRARRTFVISYGQSHPGGFGQPSAPVRMRSTGPRVRGRRRAGSGETAKDLNDRLLNDGIWRAP